MVTTISYLKRAAKAFADDASLPWHIVCEIYLASFLLLFFAMTDCIMEHLLTTTFANDTCENHSLSISITASRRKTFDIKGVIFPITCATVQVQPIKLGKKSKYYSRPLS